MFLGQGMERFCNGRKVFNEPTIVKCKVLVSVCVRKDMQFLSPPPGGHSPTGRTGDSVDDGPGCTDNAELQLVQELCPGCGAIILSRSQCVSRGLFLKDHSHPHAGTVQSEAWLLVILFAHFWKKSPLT